MAILYYVNEDNHLILISLLKQYGIRKIIASPGGTNITFVGSVQNDPFFQIYSCIDERSAAYMACGMAEETGEPVIISCTGATSSRNYMPALTEAYYRKLPIVAITSSQDNSRVGHLVAQVTDRSCLPSDVANISVHLQTVKDNTDKWDCMIKVNKALHTLTKNGGGPVHINLVSTYSKEYIIKELPKARKIGYYTSFDKFPTFTLKRVAIFVGAHHVWSKKLIESVDLFCSKHNAVVLCDHTSNYNGKYKVMSALAGLQTCVQTPLLKIDLLIHIGEISGAYDAFCFKPKEVWRVNEDGEIRDQFRTLTNVFHMTEERFFEIYNQKEATDESDSQLIDWIAYNLQLHEALPEMPFCNIWIAQQLADKVPANSVLYLGILNSLRSWSYFDVPESVRVYSNTGGFGIDGIVSTMVGSSIASPKTLHFAVLGDLSFFYDLNVLGNRQLGNNVRILVINNGKGIEFRLINHNGHIFGDDCDKYIAAGGHNGNCSPYVLKSFSESLGFKYLTASTKEQFKEVYKDFINPKQCSTPIVFEVFTETENETNTLKDVERLVKNYKFISKKKTVGIIKKIIGEKKTKLLRDMLLK